MNGLFIISLDFELNWGVFDSMSVKEYNENLKNVPQVIKRLLDLGEEYNINYTFATVGMLFNQNKEELLNSLPQIKPEYINEKFNPYRIIENVGDSEEEDKIHYAKSLIEQIKEYPNHEIASHTFSHFYCKELGQNVRSFEDDLKSFSNVANKNNVKLNSIVFPKNQINESYLSLCKKYGITSYRGTENSFLYKPKAQGETALSTRFLRFLDSYVNISGSNIYKPKDLNKGEIINIPSSRFLRPFNKKLHFLENYKIRRITNGIKKAAETNSIYHLWWHPHNFGKNLEENFKNLEKIFMVYNEVNKNNNYSSVTMSKAHDLIKKK
ncbi:polysaccharide deacetylase family protein [Polaribacter sp. IC066]|uniref:polysaccharide deacetylase family protein n=1 Tax=Polaribacter sp. IC066 TaxID=57032 RepID=UPI0011BE5525|nr:polysaccharide deacetylase family protein [Polaribacter sp. IC066]TXD56687.1 polysaccharide deacetylase family protein [Polaribacter sp. IC066]